ncbi:MAG: DUF488 domain-containing protein [Dehalococcoidia bacterium]
MLLTIGHSTRGLGSFLELLVSYQVTAVADVRSVPFSRWTPQFNQEGLRAALKQRGIAYVFLGTELGARSDDPSSYVEGRVQYRRLAESKIFQQGIKRLLEGSETQRIAVMCAEGEPLDCHRTILVARELDSAGADVAHILPDGSLEPHQASIRRLMKRLRLLQPAFFESPQGLEDRAYAEQERRIAYVRTSGETEFEAQA